MCIRDRFLLAMGAVIALLFGGASVGNDVKLALALFAVWGLANVGGLFDRRAWLPASEVARWSATIAAAALLAPAGWRIVAAGGAALLALAALVPVVRQGPSFARAGRAQEPMPVLVAGGEGVQA